MSLSYLAIFVRRSWSLWSMIVARLASLKFFIIKKLFLGGKRQVVIYIYIRVCMWWLNILSFFYYFRETTVVDFGPWPNPFICCPPFPNFKCETMCRIYKKSWLLRLTRPITMYRIFCCCIFFKLKWKTLTFLHFPFIIVIEMHGRMWRKMMMMVMPRSITILCIIID